MVQSKKVGNGLNGERKIGNFNGKFTGNASNAIAITNVLPFEIAHSEIEPIGYRLEIFKWYNV